MAKVKTFTQLRKEADRLFSLFIRARDEICQSCYRKPPDVRLQCAHIISRRYFVIRWDPDNAVALCFGCHKRFTEFPLDWDDWVTERIGAQAYQDLKDRARKGSQDDRLQPRVRYEAVIYRLKKVLKEMGVKT